MLEGKLTTDTAEALLGRQPTPPATRKRPLDEELLVESKALKVSSQPIFNEVAPTLPASQDVVEVPDDTQKPCDEQKEIDFWLSNLGHRPTLLKRTFFGVPHHKAATFMKRAFCACFTQKHDLIKTDLLSRLGHKSTTFPNGLFGKFYLTKTGLACL